MFDNDSIMRLACSIAFERMGKTSPNPAVGAVITKNGRIIGNGGTQNYGGYHAEVMAIKDALSRGEDLHGAEIFVSLEPCSHYGKTPPCTEAIIQSGIKKVYIPLLDPNPLVSGRGVQRLLDCGVDVEIMHKFFPMAADLLRGFKKYILRGKPFIINKCAMTLDGKIAANSGDSRWISSDSSRLLVHKLRSKVDAVIVGKNTFLNDNPSLNVRPGDFSEEAFFPFDMGINLTGRYNFFLEELFRAKPDPDIEPLRVLIGMPDYIPEGSNFFRDDNYVVITSKKSYNEKIVKNSNLKNFDFRQRLVVGEYDDPSKEVDFILEVLKAHGVMHAILEGGSGINGTFFNAGAIDMFMYIIAPKVAGNGIPPISGAPVEKISDSLLLYDVTTASIGRDILICGYKEQYNFEMM